MAKQLSDTDKIVTALERQQSNENEILMSLLSKTKLTMDRVLYWTSLTTVSRESGRKIILAP